MSAPINNNRLDIVDALRGLAVVAIMLLHFIEHFIYNVYPDPVNQTALMINQGVWDSLFFLFAGKSYTIFALLFGFTFILQQSNQEKKGGDFGYRFAWRLVILMLFATLNAAFFPGGDVLSLFAITGFVMIPFRKLSQKSLLIIAILFLIQPIELLKLCGLNIIPGVLNSTYYPLLNQITESGNFWDMIWANITTGQLATLAWAIDAGRFMQAPGLFIIGMILARGQYFTRFMDFWCKVFVSGVIGCFILYTATVASTGTLKTIFSMWYNIGFTGIIMSSFVLLYQWASFQKMTNGLRFYGRMSLTNYISQSIIGSLIFFPYALGLASSLGIAWSFVVGLGVMTLQIFFCRLWLSYFKQGPLETIWRKLTWIR